MSSPTFSDFKNKYCNENLLIANLLKSEFSEFIKEPFLDVGAGDGGISNIAAYHLKGYLVDIDRKGANISPYHQYILKDYFTLNLEDGINIRTILFVHSLQFLDDDLTKLRKSIQRINPLFIIDVLNESNTSFGLICSKIEDCLEISNPERNINYTPGEYIQVKKKLFNAKLQCSSFEDLAHILCRYILDAKDIEVDMESIVISIKKYLDKPVINIPQSINAYKRKCL